MPAPHLPLSTEKSRTSTGLLRTFCSGLLGAPIVELRKSGGSYYSGKSPEKSELIYIGAWQKVRATRSLPTPEAPR